MDRRQRKTRMAIFSAFRTLMTKKKYEQITVQDIIDEANIGRSTFYAHFGTKDYLLKALCSDIFDHVFSGTLCSFSSKDHELETILTHIFYHLQEEKENLSALFSQESKDIFLRYVNEYTETLFSPYTRNLPSEAPADYLLQYLTTVFAQTLNWWVKQGMTISPEKLSHCFLAVTQLKR